MEFALKFVENLGESELKSKDFNYISVSRSFAVTFGHSMQGTVTRPDWRSLTGCCAPHTSTAG